MWKLYIYDYILMLKKNGGLNKWSVVFYLKIIKILTHVCDIQEKGGKERLRRARTW